MIDGFVLATDLDLKTRRGVVYLIAFGDGAFYIGSTGQSFRQRYGTLNLVNSYLVTNDSVQSRINSRLSHWVYLHEQTLSDKESRLQLEYSFLDLHVKDIRCLNRSTGTENFGTRRKVTLKSPDGVLVDFESVNHAARFVGANNHSQVSQVLNGRMLSVCGWTLPETTGPVGSDALNKPCTLIDPDGNAVEFVSYKQASETIGVSPSSIGSLIQGQVTTIRGWTTSRRASRKYIPLKLVSPVGEVVTFRSRMEASKVIGCCNQLVSMLCIGKALHAKGWTLAEQPRLREGR